MQSCVIVLEKEVQKKTNFGLVHPAYNTYFSTCFFRRNNVFLSQQISQQCLSAQPNGAFDM
jgi:hypothetical protein